MMLQRKKHSNRKGFTLGEMVTTTAIIGILAAIAYPNFMRIHMETNMEMVKQGMRTIGEKMVEILGKTGAFPPTGNLVSGSETIPEELDVTANLSGITNKGYIPEYRLFSNGGNYALFSRPRITGVTGDKCFLTDPRYLVTDTDCWDPTGLDFYHVYTSNFFSPTLFSQFLNDPSLTRQEKADILAAWLEWHAYFTDYITVALGMTRSPSTDIFFDNNAANLSAFSDLFKDVFAILQSKGIAMTRLDRDLSNPTVSFSNYDVHSEYIGNAYSSSDAAAIMSNQSGIMNSLIGFQLSDRIDGVGTLAAPTAEELAQTGGCIGACVLGLELRARWLDVMGTLAALSGAASPYASPWDSSSSTTPSSLPSPTPSASSDPASEPSPEP